jgi:hypothetical protein
VSAPVAAWLTAAFGALLAAVQPGHPPPPVDPLLLLADAPWIWQPPALLHSLWTRFRVAYLGAAWDLHASGCDPGLGSFAEALVAGVVETLATSGRAVTRDRLRVLTDVRALGREVGVPTVWFRGRSPLLLPEAFVRLWPNLGRWYVNPGGPIQPGLLQLPDPPATWKCAAQCQLAGGPGGAPPKERGVLHRKEGRRKEDRTDSKRSQERLRKDSRRTQEDRAQEDRLHNVCHEDSRTFQELGTSRRF